MRRLPAMSEPRPMTEASSASMHASPPELPPEVYAASYGLVVRPHMGLLHSYEYMVCGTLVLTKGTAPASTIARTNYA
jgi:hypothetical protein